MKNSVKQTPCNRMPNTTPPKWFDAKTIYRTTATAIANLNRERNLKRVNRGAMAYIETASNTWPRAIAAAMALGQVFEAVSMYAMAPLLTRFRLRSLFRFAIAVAVVRYIVFASNHLGGVVFGILLHGVCFTLFFIPVQIYIEQRIARELRFRAQALLTLLISGFGNLLGFLVCGAPQTRNPNKLPKPLMSRVRSAWARNRSSRAIRCSM